MRIKTDLAVQFHKEQLFNVYFVCVKLMDKLDVIQDHNIQEERIYDYPSQKKKMA